MINSTIKVFLLISPLLALFPQARSQEKFILDKPGSMFRKNERRAPLPVKTRYFFETSAATGREYLRQQDLLDPKGRFKSSGVFSDDGNKAADIRYTYDASGILQKKELRKIGKNEVEVTYLNQEGKPTRHEIRTKGDTLLAYITYAYDGKGYLQEEASFTGNKLVKKRIFDDQYNDQGKPTQTYCVDVDSSGNKLPGPSPLSVHEYDDKGMILQTTVYSNKDKRKMLNWVYYKYQLDNDYKVIRQTGYNEEQAEISRIELVYTDSSIQETSFKLCACQAKTIDKIGSRQFVYNNFGELIRERIYNESGALLQTSSFRYDDFGNRVDTLIEKTAEPGKINRSKIILEVYADQAKMSK
jgi:hypothetical protein